MQASGFGGVRLDGHGDGGCFGVGVEVDEELADGGYAYQVGY